MRYAHNFEKAVACAKKAFEHMMARNIPPHPNNFVVWYTYCSGEDQELGKVLDILIDNNQEFSEERNASVYNKFCTSPYEAVPMHLIAERMEAELTAAVSVLEKTGRDVATYGDSLQEVRTKVREARGAQDVVQLLAGMLTQTRAMASQSREVEGQLRQSWTEVSKLREELEDARREAMTDALTGLANRKMFDFMLRDTATAAMEAGLPLSLLFLDIDHFKNFNDTYGHTVGDHVLKLLATVLRDTCKGQDTPARYGGEEFAVILPQTTIPQAASLAESIRGRVAAKGIVNRKTGEQLGRVNVSIGVAGLIYGESMRQFIERADNALYMAKRTGRNKVVVQEGKLDKTSIALAP
ncbi:MAG: GGDEF domain-containing protein [Defluviicoccus sp.]